MQRKLKDLRAELAKVLSESLGSSVKGDYLASWDPFDSQSSSKFFDPIWMFGSSISEGFNVVIGNPPYVNFRDIKDQKIKKYYFDNYKTIEYQSDLYVLFIEKSYQLFSKKVGSISLIVPNSLTNNLNNTKVREFLLRNTNIITLVDAPRGIFETATVDNTILTFSSQETNRDIKCFQVLSSQFVSLDTRIQSEFLENFGFNLNFTSNKNDDRIIAGIEEDCTLLDDICLSSSGIKEYELGKGTPPQTVQDRENKIYNSSNKISSDYFPHLVGNDIRPYNLSWGGGYILYGKNLAAPRDPKFFRGERLIIREIPGKETLQVSFTNENYTVKNTAHIFILSKKEFNIFSLCGILNSRLIGFYFRTKFSEKDDVFPKAKIGQCRLLPIRNVIDKNLSVIVQKIIKKSEKGEGFSSLERDMNNLVYKIYGMSKKDISYIESALTGNS